MCPFLPGMILGHEGLLRLLFPLPLPRQSRTRAHVHTRGREESWERGPVRTLAHATQDRVGQGEDVGFETDPRLEGFEERIRPLESEAKRLLC